MSKLQKYLKIENTAKELEYDTHRLTSNSLAVPIEDILSLGEIDHLSDVTLNAVATNHMLVYNDSTDKWENKDPANVLSSLGITASIAELNILDIDTALNANTTTRFLRADGTWQPVTASGISGLTGDSNTNQLNVAEDYKFVFEGNTSDDFETTLQVEDPTADRAITFPDDFGEVSLSPIYTNFYYKNITETAPFIFTKNNERVLLVGGAGQYQSNNNFYVILPDWSTITSSTSINDTSLFLGDPAKGISYKLARSIAGKVFIAPSLSGDDIEIIGNDSWDSTTPSRVVSYNNIVQGKTYKIIDGTGWTNLGAANNTNTTFFTATQNGNNSGSGSAFECLEISANDFKSGWIDIIGIKQHGAQSYYYNVSQPSRLLESPTLKGTATFENDIISQNVKGTTSLQIQESGGGTDTINLKAPALASTYDLTLPDTDGDSNQIMKSDGNGNLSWVTILNENDFASGSQTGIPTQNSVKEYISTQMLSINATSQNANSYTINNTTPTATLILSDVNSTPQINFTSESMNYNNWINNQAASLTTFTYKIFMPPVDSSLLGSKVQIKIVNLTNQSSNNKYNRIIIQTNSNDAKAGTSGNTTYSNSEPNAVFIQSGARDYIGSLSHYDDKNYYQDFNDTSAFQNTTSLITFELYKEENYAGPDGTLITAYIWKRIN